MANVYGVNTTKVNAGTKNGNWVSQGLIKSGLKIMSDSYEAVALAAGQTIGLANLPAGAVVHGILLYADALGAGVTVTLGDSHTAARYSSAVVCTSAVAVLADKVDGSGYVIGTNSGDTALLATIGVGAATGTIKVVVLYTN